MNNMHIQPLRQIRVNLGRKALRPTLPPFQQRQRQRRHYAAEPGTRYQKGDKTLPWPLIIFGGLVFVMVPMRYFLYMDKDGASEHQHSGSSGAGPAGSEDHVDKTRDKRDSPNKGSR